MSHLHRFSLRSPLLPIALAAFAFSLSGCPKKDDASKDKDSKSSKDKKDKKKKGGDDDDDKGSSGDDKTSADVDPFSAKLEGTKFKMKSAWVTMASQYGWMYLSTGKETCGDSKANEVDRLEIDIHSGPGDSYYSGTGPVGVSVKVNQFKDKNQYKAWAIENATMTIDKGFKWKKDAHLKGTLDFDYVYVSEGKTYTYKGSGSFDAQVCDDHSDLWWSGSPDSVDGPLKGKFDDTKFTAKSAIATVSHNQENDYDYIDGIKFYPDEDVDCGDQSKEEKGKAYLSLSGPIAGANSKQKFTSPQPASLYYYAPKGTDEHDSNSVWGDAWVKFDKLGFKVGSEITGSLYAESNKSDSTSKKGKFGGNFTAKVCKW